MRAQRFFLVAALALSTSALPARLTAQCNTCSDICGVNAHMDFCGTAFFGFSGMCLPNYCHFGACWSVHYPDCGGFADLTRPEIDRVVRAAQDGAADQLRVFLLSSDQVFLNVERHSVQVRGCNGEIIASITLVPAVLATLRELEPALAMRASRPQQAVLAAVTAALPR